MLVHRFVQDDVTPVDSCELLHRVRRGVKPVATVLIKLQEIRYATDRAVLGAAKGFGLRSGFFSRVVLYDTG